MTGTVVEESVMDDHHQLEGMKGIPATDRNSFDEYNLDELSAIGHISGVESLENMRASLLVGNRFAMRSTRWGETKA